MALLDENNEPKDKTRLSWSDVNDEANSYLDEDEAPVAARKLDVPKLKSETNTHDMKVRVIEAAHDMLSISKTDLQAEFAHGQWWVKRLSTGAQWSVFDFVGYKAVDGFDFEQIC